MPFRGTVVPTSCKNMYSYGSVSYRSVLRCWCAPYRVYVDLGASHFLAPSYAY